MPRMLDREDDKYYYYSDGGKTAKAPLSQSKRDAMSAEIQKNKMAATAPQSADPFEATSFEPIASASQLSRNAPQMSQAPAQSVLRVPVVAPGLGQAPLGQNPIAQPAGTMDMTPFNRPMTKGVVTTESISGTPVSKEETNALTRSYDAQIQATKDFAKARGEAQVELAKINEDTQRSLDMINYERSLIQEKQQNAVNEFDAKYADTMAQLENAKIDPDRFYGGSVGKRVLAGISIAMGAIGSAFTGQRNYALDIINKAIDDDIAAQKEGIQKLGAQAQLQRQFLSDIKSRFKDQDEAQLAQKAALLEMAQAKIAQINSRISNAEQTAKGETLSAQLEAQKVDTLMKARQLAAGKVITKTQQEFGGGGIDSKEIRELRKDFLNDDVTKKTRAIRNSAAQVRTNLALKTGVGDLAAIIMLAKTLDPASVVREGEVETIRKTGGPADFLVGYYNRIKGEGLMSDEMRADISSQIDAMEKTQNKEQEKVNKFYLRSIPAGVDPRLIIDVEEQEQPISQTFKPKAQPVTAKPQSQIMRGR